MKPEMKVFWAALAATIIVVIGVTIADKAGVFDKIIAATKNGKTAVETGV